MPRYEVGLSPRQRRTTPAEWVGLIVVVSFLAWAFCTGSAREGRYEAVSHRTYNLLQSEVVSETDKVWLDGLKEALENANAEGQRPAPAYGDDQAIVKRLNEISRKCGLKEIE